MTSPRGLTLWLTGLSGAGKSTVAALVAARLRRDGQAVVLLDGEHARAAISPTTSFDKAGRDAHVRRLAAVADGHARAGSTVIVAAISPYRETRAEARALMAGRFAEVHVKASLEECARRDVKGLYARALRGEIEHFTGVSDPYEEPVAADLVLDTERSTPHWCAERVIALAAGLAD